MALSAREMQKRQEQQRRKLQAAGLCTRCRKPTGTKGPRCTVCLAHERERYHARVAQGACVICGVQAVTGTFCFKHWLKNIGSFHGLNRSNGGLDILQQLWDEQRGHCALTARPLLPGVNASIDHIVPVSRGGQSVKDNLRWVLTDVNRAKFDLSHDQFVELCRDVVRVADAAEIDSASSSVLCIRSN